MEGKGMGETDKTEGEGREWERLTKQKKKKGREW